MGNPESSNSPGDVRRGIAAYKQTLPHPPLDGLLKTRGLGDALSKGLGRPGESKYQRAAKFLILIGGDEAARILAALDAEQVEEIAREIAAVRGITADEAEAVFEEFRGLLKSSGGAAGGVEEARRILYAAFGPGQGETFLKRVLPEVRNQGNPLAFLDNFTGEQAAFLLREETPAAAAMILSRLSPEMSAAVLARTAPAQKLEIIKRIAHLGQVSPEVLERVAETLREKARRVTEAGGGSLAAVDGMNALTAILKHADNSFGERLLSELVEEDPALGRGLKERLHTLEDVVDAEDLPVQEKLAAMDERDIALLLKGRSPEFTEKILSNVSVNRRALIMEESELMGPVPRIEVEAAARDFLAWFRLGREAGKILLRTDKDVIL
jgi:flagellar motor switch protein FliG